MSPVAQQPISTSRLRSLAYTLRVLRELHDADQQREREVYEQREIEQHLRIYRPE